MTEKTGSQPALVPMTRERCHELFRHWENDPAVYAEAAQFVPYVYDPAAVDRYWESRQGPDRMMLAVTLGGAAIGEVQLKQIDRVAGEAVLSIHLQNDAVKNKGYGTCAERLALRLAFEELGLETVYADALAKNTRSCRVLDKAGFAFLREENGFRYYRCQRSQWRIDAKACGRI